MRYSFFNFYLYSLSAEFLDGCLDGGIMLGCYTEFGQVERGKVCFLNVLHIERLLNHADSAGVVGDGVNQDEGSCGFVEGCPPWNP